MALYRGYLEARLGTLAARRFLLDFDVSVIGQAVNAEPKPPPIGAVNLVDLSPPPAGSTTAGSPDLRVQVIVRRAPPLHTETLIEIRFAPEARLTQLEARVYIDLDQTVYPITGASTVPGSFAYFGYTGAPGEVAPADLRVTLQQRTSMLSGLPVSEIDVGVTVPLSEPRRVGPGRRVVPRKVGGGRLEGPVVLTQAVETHGGGAGAGAYTEIPRSQARTASPDSPSATMLSTTLTDRGAAAAPTQVGVQVRTPHAPDPPPTAPTAALAHTGAGGVTRGHHRYAVTFLAQNGTESGMSPPSAAIEVVDPTVDGWVAVRGIPVGKPLPAGADPGLAVVGRRIYRTLASATGDSGEFFQVFEIPNNTDTTWDDGRADRAAPADPPRPRPRDELQVDWQADRVLDVDGGLDLRSPTPPAGFLDQQFLAELRSVPTAAHVHHVTRPAVGQPRLLWTAADSVESLRLRSFTLQGPPYRYLEARGRAVPNGLGADWSIEGDSRLRIELGGLIPGQPLGVEAGDLAFLLASSPRPWRDAPQTVCAELVDRRHDDGSTDDARLRVGIRGLLRARVALGEGGGRHSAWDDGIKLDLLLGPDRLGGRPAEGTRERALRLLRISDVPGPAGRDRSHLRVRAGNLPDQTQLELRSTPAPAGRPESAGYFGFTLDGALERVTMLVLADPTAAAPAFDADGLRLWLATPATGRRLDVLRTGGDTLVASGDISAQASVRSARGLGGGADPVRLVAAAATLPARVQAAPPIVFVPGAGTTPMRTAYSVAGAGSTATRIRSGDGLTFFGGDTIRFVGGPLAGQRRLINAITPGGAAADVAAFSAAPGPGDAFVLERFDGAASPTGVSGAAVETLARSDGVPAISGRVALTRDLGGGAPIATRATDRLVATTATPQIKARTTGTAGLRAATARVLGITRLNATLDEAGPAALDVALDKGRVNPAFRAQVRDLDTRFADDERDLLKVRISSLPPDLMARTDVGPAADRPLAVVEARLSAPAGEGAFWMEPGLVRDSLAGQRAGSVAGIGLIEGAFDGLPRAARVSLLAAMPPGVPAGDLVPHNWTPPTGWMTSGVKLELAEMLHLQFVRQISWGADRTPANINEPPDAPVGVGLVLDDGLLSIWGRLDARFITIDQQGAAADTDPPRLDPLLLWLPAERPPANSHAPGGGLGFLIDPMLRVTLDLDGYVAPTQQHSSRWDRVNADLVGWQLVQELQMQAYQGEVTVATPLQFSPAGDPNAGPGKWFLRVLKSLDSWPAVLIGFGSVYFGNTGGNFWSRPRIFA